MLRTVVSALLATLLAAPAAAYDPAPAAPAAPSQFTFAWPLGESALKPRGASTKGTAVTLDTAPSAAWTALRDPALTPFERDRAAILAMAGEYRVSFDFLEIARFDPALKPDAPYQSWGTEVVLVGREERDLIALQHILVMRMVDKDGKESEPMVMRHWRQEWRFEPASMLAYRGNLHWEMQPLSDDERRGAWVQNVYQVDESPRYGSIGRWEHNGSYSTWIGSETVRPLPRREWSVREDYQVLRGTNRHTVTATGWVQEENNLKEVLTTADARAQRPFLAREYGVARYERIRDFDFSAGRTYNETTEPLWVNVRFQWGNLLARKGGVRLKAPADQGQLFTTFFELADKFASGEVKPNPLVEQMTVKRVLREVYLKR